MVVYLLLAIVASSLMAAGLLMMKSRSAYLPVAAGANLVGAIVTWIREPMWIGGIAVQTAGWVCYVIAVSHAPVSAVAVMMQGGIGLFVIASVIVLGERASAREWVGIGAIVVAMLMLTLSLSSAAVEDSFRPAVLLTFTGLLAVAALAPMAVARMNTSGAAIAILSGVAFGLGAMFTKSMTLDLSAVAAAPLAVRVALNPYVYGMLAANLTGMVLLQNSFHSSRAIIAMPLSGATSNIVPIIGGMLVFSERLPAEPIAAAARLGAFALTIVAGALLAGTREQLPVEPIVVRAAAGR
jgi:multidrug transporter EmrE-like cation transporter